MFASCTSRRRPSCSSAGCNLAHSLVQRLPCVLVTEESCVVGTMQDETQGSQCHGRAQVTHRSSSPASASRTTDVHDARGRVQLAQVLEAAHRAVSVHLQRGASGARQRAADHAPPHPQLPERPGRHHAALPVPLWRLAAGACKLSRKLVNSARWFRNRLRRW